MKITEILWYVFTLGLVALAIIGSIFSWWALPWFLWALGICIAASIILGFITGHLDFSRKYI